MMITFLAPPPIVQYPGEYLWDFEYFYKLFSELFGYVKDIFSFLYSAFTFLIPYKIFFFTVIITFLVISFIRLIHSLAGG